MAGTSVPAITGLHHVTLMARDAAQSCAFYREVLGFRLVKRTVNYDDPKTYHLYFGDRDGTPGTVVTVFPYPTMRTARRGANEIAECALAVPADSIERWSQRLRDLGVESESGETLGERRVRFRDPDGTVLALVESAHTEMDFKPWIHSSVRPAMAISRIHSVTLALTDEDPVARVLVGRLGFREAGGDVSRRRFHVAEGGPGRAIDLVRTPHAEPARAGAGSIHHVALSTPAADQQDTLYDELFGAHIGVSSAVDRTYFRSIYFRLTTGVLFEIATHGPGFTADEPRETLGEHLQLPQGLEHLRSEIVAQLPRLDATSV
ncbi:MAG: VOC family protein [Planctomycetota bacterium]